MSKYPILAVIALSLAAPVLSGCVAVAATGIYAGVSAVRQERTFGAAIDDVRIKSAVTSRLAGAEAWNFVNVSTTVIEGRVLMTGRVDDPEERLAATRIAWGVEGVRRVDNVIEITDSAGLLNRPRDIFIRTEIAADLLSDAAIKDVNYTIDVVNGVVYITGVGQNQAEVDRVIARASRFKGVKRVENFVVLKDDPQRYFGAATAPATPEA
nr:MAG: BON domain-containing protein [Hyphomicrobiales bacterium]